MVAAGAGVVGALVGVVIGIALSVYVAFLDMRKRSEGTRARAQYRGSLVMVPAILAGLGALVGIGIARLA
jgi:ABC-type antimicrobial peptide transport system permease subunit